MSVSMATTAFVRELALAVGEDAWLGATLRTAALALAAGWCAYTAALGALGVAYDRLTADNAFKLDAYLPGGRPPVRSRAKVVAVHALNVGLGRAASASAVPLAEAASAHVPGLRVTSRLGPRPDGARLPPPPAEQAACGASADRSIVVGTIRMGFGHHRIAYAAASWGVASGRRTYFHDLLAVDSAEADLIRDADKLYSRGSRLASELGGAVERAWGGLTKSGDADALRATYQMAEHLAPLLRGLDRRTPIVATHCLVGLAAVAAGFSRVINLVIDNHAQWFVVVPGALNLVQGPANYAALLKMGVPPSELRLAGHWAPKALVDNLEADCAARAARARGAEPARLLLPVGGAGAQRAFITGLVRALGPAVRGGRVRLLLNAGDHAHMREAFEAALAHIGLAPRESSGEAGGGAAHSYALVRTWAGVHALADRLLGGGQLEDGATLFAFDDYFPAVGATDVLCRVADVLCCKPSELAFHPVPKLMLRRVGDHEAHSATRASELGDGTAEVRELGEALAYCELLCAPGGALRVAMNDALVRNARAGHYNGCRAAIEAAIDMT